MTEGVPSESTSQFVRMGAAYAAVVLGRQVEFENQLEDGNWHADLSVPSLTVGPDTYTAWLLGSAATETNSWLWGWGNEAFGIDHPAVAPTVALRDLGQQYNVPELSTAALDLASVPDPGLGAAEALAVVGAGLLGGLAYHRAAYDGGTAYLLVVDPEATVSSIPAETLPQLLLTAVQAFPADNWLTVQTFIGHHRLPARRTTEGVAARLPDGGSFEAVFDGEQHLVDVRISTNAG